MSAKNDLKKSQKTRHKFYHKMSTGKKYTPRHIILSHKDAKSASPCGNTGDEDPGAALESLVAVIDRDNH